MKPSKRPKDINPNELQLGVKVNGPKIADVKSLLEKHYGDQWFEIDTVKWYKEVIDNNELKPDNPQLECECFYNEPEQHEVNQLVV